MDLKAVDIVAQIGISTLGVLAIVLVARKNKWGFVIGLASQPFWYATTCINHQWGIMPVNIVYTFTWIYGIYTWFRKKPLRPA